MTALGTPGAQDLAATFGCHAGPEAMDAFALDDARLKGSFHGIGTRTSLRESAESYDEGKCLSIKNLGLACWSGAIPVDKSGGSG